MVRGKRSGQALLSALHTTAIAFCQFQIKCRGNPCVWLSHLGACQTGCRLQGTVLFLLGPDRTPRLDQIGLTQTVLNTSGY